MNETREKTKDIVEAVANCFKVRQALIDIAADLTVTHKIVMMRLQSLEMKMKVKLSKKARTAVYSVQNRLQGFGFTRQQMIELVLIEGAKSLLAKTRADLYKTLLGEEGGRE